MCVHILLHLCIKWQLSKVWTSSQSDLLFPLFSLLLCLQVSWLPVWPRHTGGGGGWPPQPLQRTCSSLLFCWAGVLCSLCSRMKASIPTFVLVRSPSSALCPLAPCARKCVSMAALYVRKYVGLDLPLNYNEKCHGTY